MYQSNETKSKIPAIQDDEQWNNLGDFIIGKSDGETENKVSAKSEHHLRATGYVTPQVADEEHTVLRRPNRLQRYAPTKTPNRNER